MKFDSIEARPIWLSNVLFTSKVLSSFIVVVLLLLGLSTYSDNTIITNNFKFNSIPSFVTTKNNIKISVYNEYNLLYGQPGQQYPWITMIVVEPYRTTNLEVILTSDDSNIDDSDIVYYWTIGGDQMRYEGQKIQYEFQKLAYYNISVIQVQKSTKQILQSTMQEVVCRYVRREIRKLTEEDREDFFNALEIAYSVSSQEGKEKYGDNFVNAQTVTAIHNKRAGDVICDHMHDGYGFMNSHMALTLVFEMSLQSINPKVTIPYWDYTIDTVDMTITGSIDSFQSSIIFDDDWFGEIAPPSKVMTRGRFAYLPVQTHMFNSTTTVHNAYGYLRAPWNQNKIPYITRSNGMCGFRITDLATCDQHYKLLKVNAFDDFLRLSQYGPHGTIHIAIGGMWGSNWQSHLEKVGYNMSETGSFDNAIFTKYKNMFRSRLLQCPEYCSADTSTNDCKCTCPNYDEYISNPVKLETVVNAFMIGTDVDSKFYEVFLNLLCNKFEDSAPLLGDQLESASPGDPSFWPIHPTMERLYLWKRLNGFETLYWRDNNSWSFWEGTTIGSGYCDGHNLDDVVGFQGLFGPYLSGVYTNADFIHFTNPSKDYLPFIYDHFTWDHCAQQGYPLTFID